LKSRPKKTKKGETQKKRKKNLRLGLRQKPEANRVITEKVGKGSGIQKGDISRERIEKDVDNCPVTAEGLGVEPQRPRSIAAFSTNPIKEVGAAHGNGPGMKREL